MEDHEALDEMVTLTGAKGVPVIVCGREVLIGFRRSRLEQILDCANNKTPV